MSDITRELLRSRHQIIEGYPNDNEGREGERVYCSIGGRINEYIKHQHSWQLLSSTADVGEENKKVIKTIAKRVALTHSGDNDEFIKKDGSRDFTGDQSHGGHDITNVGDLDVDGATSLDRTAINTTDGGFTVTGANPSSISTTGSNDISLTSGQDININPAGELDIDADTVDLDVTRGFDADIGEAFSLTGSTNMTMEATGSAANTMLVQNTNNHASSFNGINIKTNSGNTASCFNRILIECDNIASKGADYGVEIRSENNIRIAAENANNGNATGLLMRATGPIDIGVSDSLTPHTDTNRVKIHGIFETGNLWRDSDDPIIMDKGSIEDDSASGEYTKFEAIDTQKLLRNYTYKASGNVADDAYLDIVVDANADETNGTVWLVTVVFENGIYEGINTGYCFRMNNNVIDPETIGYLIQYYEHTGNGGQITWHSTEGIRWQNKTGSGSAIPVKASAQKIQSGNDFS